MDGVMCQRLAMVWSLWVRSSLATRTRRSCMRVRCRISGKPFAYCLAPRQYSLGLILTASCRKQVRVEIEKTGDEIALAAWDTGKSAWPYEKRIMNRELSRD